MSFIKDLLWIINELGELLPEGKGNYRSLNQRLRGVPKGTYYKSLERLEQRKLIRKVYNQKGQKVYKITKDGKDVLNLHLNKQLRKDGLATLITYDIPSSKDRERTSFRRFLIRNGFISIQKSLLVSPNIFDKDLLKVTEELKITKYIKIVSGRFDYYQFK